MPLQPAWVLVEQEAHDPGSLPHEGGWAARHGPFGVAWSRGRVHGASHRPRKHFQVALGPTFCTLPAAMSNLPAARRLYLRSFTLILARVKSSQNPLCQDWEWCWERANLLLNWDSVYSLH